MVSAFHGRESDVIRELARVAVRRLAPQEMAFFEETAEAYFEDPVQASWKARTEPLGIGIDALVVASWTLLALPVASSVIGNIATDRVREARRRGWWLTDRFRMGPTVSRRRAAEG
ncbi:hypothetical protein, partial [Streptomyces pratensis]|uniref:hypothetical protein n=1 Tax=Streptomyces pratensis TaxID=1169025 RepID=UPI0036431DD0